MRNSIRAKPTERNKSVDVPIQFLLGGAAMIFAVMLILIGKRVLDAGRQMIENENSYIVEQANILANQSLYYYDGREITGSDVTNLTYRYLKDDTEKMAGLNIVIKWKADGHTIWLTQDSVLDLRDPDSTAYISPASRWKCEMLTNDNGVIYEIRFEQK